MQRVRGSLEANDPGTGMGYVFQRENSRPTLGIVVGQIPPQIALCNNFFTNNGICTPRGWPLRVTALSIRTTFKLL